MTVNHFHHKGPQQTRILYGQPGTGKTTFLKYLSQKVAINEPSNFSLIRFFPLRDKAVSQALKDDSEAGLEQLLRYYIPGKKCSTSTEALLESEGENVLLIFDGADEARSLIASPEGSILGALLEGRLLPQAHFIVTTRPSGCPLLQEHRTVFYEILRFDEAAVESYVKDFFKSEPGKGETMISDLRALLWWSPPLALQPGTRLINTQHSQLQPYHEAGVLHCLSSLPVAQSRTSCLLEEVPPQPHVRGGTEILCQSNAAQVSRGQQSCLCHRQ